MRCRYACRLSLPQFQTSEPLRRLRFLFLWFNKQRLSFLCFEPRQARHGLESSAGFPHIISLHASRPEWFPGRVHIINSSWRGPGISTNRILSPAYNKTCRRRVNGTVRGVPEEPHIFPGNLAAESCPLTKALLHKGRREPSGESKLFFAPEYRRMGLAEPLQ